MDLRIVVDFSEYVAFYLLLGWSNNPSSLHVELETGSPRLLF